MTFPLHGPETCLKICSIGREEDKFHGRLAVGTLMKVINRDAGSKDLGPFSGLLS